MNLTFVIPAFGNSKYLVDCINSLKKQTIPCEIVITTSSCSQWLRDLARINEINLVEHEKGGAIAKDWNFALGFPKAEIVVLAHQDDIYHPCYAFEVINFFKINSNTGFLFTDASEMLNDQVIKLNVRIFVKKMLVTFGFLWKRGIGKPTDFWRLLSFGCPIPCPSVAYRPTFLKHFSFSDNFIVNLDWDAWSRLGKSGVICGYIPKQLVIHRLHDESETKKAIASSIRFNEDRALFLRYWPKWALPVLLSLYRLGY
jgi:glycosyltransferase involved in cell wall biosynthesis